VKQPRNSVAESVAHGRAGKPAAMVPFLREARQFVSGDTSYAIWLLQEAKRAADMCNLMDERLKVVTGLPAAEWMA
jgi:hypothetical protein